MKHLYIIFLFLVHYTFSQTLVPPSELTSYYNGITFSASNTNFYDDLATTTIGAHTNFLTYSERHNHLYNADADPNNTNNVILVYSGESRPDDQWLSVSNPNPTQTYNTEHIYPRSLLDTGVAEADLHVLRVCDINVNSTRGNDPFIAGTGIPNEMYFSTGSGFFPGEDWRGDIARIIMYANLRYNEPFDDVGTLALFLEWNAADPVINNGIEDNRNSEISAVQGNRNPFIDNPYLATFLWGGTPAQNRWATLSANDLQQDNDFILSPNPALNTVHIELPETVETKIEIYDILGKRVFSRKISTSRNLDISSLKSGLYIVRCIQKDRSVSKKLVKS